MSQYTITYKYGKHTRQFKIKRELKNFPSRNKNNYYHFTAELNEKEVIELLEDLYNILGCFHYERIVPLALVGYEMIKANEACSVYLSPHIQ